MIRMIRPPSPATAISLLALVIALGGTSFAVTATLVKIVDTTGANIAAVDRFGYLHTKAAPIQPQTPVFGGQFVFTGGTNSLIPANNATVVLTSLSFDNYFAQTNRASVQIEVFQQFGSGTVCNGATRQIASYDIAAGQSHQDVFPSGLVLKAASGVWCLSAGVIVEGSPSTYFLPGVLWNGYIASGSLPAGFSLAGNATQEGMMPPRVGRQPARMVVD
jgi:hypothetical protein